MRELIDREVAINAFYTATADGDEVEFCVDVIKGLPTVQAPRWHRVEDELPEIGQIVLVYDDRDRLSICQLDKQYRWLRQGGGWFDGPYVRYWMPIEPPKGDA